MYPKPTKTISRLGSGLENNEVKFFDYNYFLFTAVHSLCVKLSILHLEHYKVYFKNVHSPPDEFVSCAMTEERMRRLNEIGFKWSMGKGQYGMFIHACVHIMSYVLCLIRSNGMLICVMH